MKKISRIITCSDFLYSNYSFDNYGETWSIKTMEYQIEQATSAPLEYFRISQSKQDVFFNRQTFFELSNIKLDCNVTNFSYVLDDILPASIEYLKSFFPQDALFIGCGISAQTQEIINKIGLSFINIWNHPVHYMEDLFFAWNTNHPQIHKKLLNYKVDDRLFTLYANYFKIKLMWNINDKNNPLLDNSALFIGQSMRDKSVEENGKFLNICSYQSKVLDLKKHYTKLYYAPHPKHRFNQEVEDFIKTNSDFIEIIANQNSYELLANPRIKKVIGISSSTLFEAKCFGKEIEYFFRPFCEFNDDFDFRKNYVGIKDDNYSINFWQEILNDVMSINKSAKDLNFSTFTNRIRDLRPQSLYWGYKDLDKVQSFISKQERNDYPEYLRQHRKWFIKLYALLFVRKKYRKSFLSKIWEKA